SPPRPRRMERQARAPVVGRDRGAHPRARAELRHPGSHRADLRPRVLRRRKPRPDVGQSALPMKSFVTFDLRIPRITNIRFRLRIWTFAVLALVLIGAPLLELVGQLAMEQPAVGSPPPLSDAQRITGALHFARGARDWREAELRLHDGKVLPLRCRRFLAS